MKGLLFISSFLTFKAYTEEVINIEKARENYSIDSRYKAGNYLIYNCYFRHYACVDFDGSVACNQERKEAQFEGLHNYPCAFLKTFKSKEECIHKNYDVEYRNALVRFCFKK